MGNTYNINKTSSSTTTVAATMDFKAAEIKAMAMMLDTAKKLEIDNIFGDDDSDSDISEQPTIPTSPDTIDSLDDSYHESEEIDLSNKAIVTVQALTVANPRTQKARGIRALNISRNTNLSVYLQQTTSEPYFISSKVPLSCFSNSGSKKNFRLELSENHDKYIGWMDYEANTIFARPCPTVPRHGFVDSRIVKTMRQLRKVIEETRQADPNGEVLLTPYIPAKHSAVVTEDSVSVGPGNDGATAGKKAVSIPCTSNLRKVLKNMRRICLTKNGNHVSAMNYAGFRPSDRGVYLEFVNNDCVQLRYGPKTGLATDRYAGVNYNHFSAVWKVWRPLEEELKDFNLFERELNKQFTMPTMNGVIYLPNSTLSSHAAVQAICFGIAVVCGKAKEPIAGQKYNFAPAIFTPIDHQTAAKVAVSCADYGAKIPLIVNSEVYNHPLAWALGVVQGMSTSQETEIKIGFTMTAIAIIIRYGFAACFGEHRRYYAQGPGYSESSGGTGVGVTGAQLKYPYPEVHISNVSRSYVQQCFLQYDISDRTKVYDILGQARAVEYDFNRPGWSSGFGGPRWAECTRLVSELYLAWLEQFNSGAMVNTSMPIRTTRIIQAANRFITQCHNGGKCLTKFLSQSVFDMASNAPGLLLTQKLSFLLGNHIVYNEALNPTKKFTYDNEETNDDTAELDSTEQ